MAEEFASAMPCSEPGLTDLKRKLLRVISEINGEIRTQGKGRDTRFFVKGLYHGPGVLDDEVGNICLEDNIAVLFQLDDKPDGAWTVNYGNVQGITAFRNHAQRPVKSVHLQEETGTVSCKWFKPVMKNGKHVSLQGKLAFQLLVNEPEGYNSKEAPRCPHILSAVRMIPDSDNKCMLLVEEDRLWVEKELKALLAHNKKYAKAKKKAPWPKPIRPNHDALKATNV